MDFWQYILGGGLLGGVLTFLKYVLNSQAKDRREFMDFIERTQKENNDLHTNKNNHMERLAGRFDESVRTISKEHSSALHEIAGEIKRLNDNYGGRTQN